MDAGWSFEDLPLWDLTGRLIAAIPPPRTGYRTPSNVAIARPLYGAILRAAAEKAGAVVRTGATIATFVKDADGTTASLNGAGGAPEGRYDLVVGFDSIRSAVWQYVGTAKPVYAGSAVWRAALDGIRRWTAS